MRDMAQSICLLKLCQITMRKNRYFVSAYLKLQNEPLPKAIDQELFIANDSI